MSITIDVRQASSEIQLNTNEIEVTSAELVLATGERVAVSSISYDKDVERAILAVPAPVGTHQLVMTYTGILNDQMAGFYRSEYTVANGEKRFMAVTQFEATDARRAFPCWDEPAVKATFKVRTMIRGISANSS